MHIPDLFTSVCSGNKKARWEAGGTYRRHLGGIVVMF